MSTSGETGSCSSNLFMYEQRSPAQTPFYKIVQNNLETWLAMVNEAEGPGVPKHVEKAFRDFLECGIPAFGFARAYCSNCKHSYIVPFSCKKRGVCPSCGTKHMVQTAAHLTDNVFPRVPVRQWVLSFPKRIRYFLHNDPRVASALLRIFLRALETKLRQRSPDAPKQARTGGVSFIHRFGSSLKPKFED